MNFPHLFVRDASLFLGKGYGQYLFFFILFLPYLDKKRRVLGVFQGKAKTVRKPHR